MLENLVGPDGIASEELVDDIRKLSGLTPDALCGLANVFHELGDSVLYEEAKFLKTTENNVKTFQKEPALLARMGRITSFIFERWARRNLTKEKIIDDLTSVGITKEQQKHLEPILAAMEKNIATARAKMLENTVLAVGIPKLRSVICSCDVRPIFGDNKYDEERGDEQPYLVLDHFVPVVTLEMVACLNEEETTHTFLLDEEDLDDLYKILQRAKKRMERVKEALKKLHSLKG
jgi:hypothetical protein